MQYFASDKNRRAISPQPMDTDCVLAQRHMKHPPLEVELLLESIPRQPIRVACAMHDRLPPSGFAVSGSSPDIALELLDACRRVAGSILIAASARARTFLYQS